MLLGGEEGPSLLAIDLEQGRAVLTQNARAAAYYRSTVAELGLQAPIKLSSEGRPLPRWQQLEALEGTLGQAETDLAQLTLAPIDWNAVLSAGGCAKVSPDGPEHLIEPRCPEVEVEAPAAVALPSIGPAPTCPDGWVGDDIDLLLAMPRAGPEEGPQLSVQTCDPATEEHDGQEISCGPDELRPPSASSCLPIGQGCSGPAWPSGLDAGRTIYVDLTAPGGGDGAIDRPLSALGPALRLVSGTTTIALGPGVFAGSYALPPGVRIIGRCPTLTSFSGALTVSGDAQLKNVALRGAVVVTSGATLAASAVALGAMSVRSGAVVRLRRALLSGAVSVDDARLDARRSMITADLTVDGGRADLWDIYGTGTSRFSAMGSSTISLGRSHIFGAFHSYVGQLTLRDVVIDGPAVFDRCLDDRRAKVCARKTSLDFSRVRILRSRDRVYSSSTAIMIRGLTPERHVTLSDLVVLTPHHRAGGEERFERTLGGAAVLDAFHEDADRGGPITLVRALFDGGPGAGLRLYRSTTTLTDVHVIAIDGVGLAVSDGVVQAKRLTITGCRDGLDLGEPSSEIRGEDLRVDHCADPITVHNSTTFEANRLELSAQTGAELLIGRLPSAQGSLDPATVKIRNLRTRRPVGPGFGVEPGVLIANNASVKLTDFELINEAGSAIQFEGSDAAKRLTFKRGIARGLNGLWWDDQDAPANDEGGFFEGVRSQGERAAFRHGAADQR